MTMTTAERREYARVARYADAHVDEIIDAVQADENIGYCIACGAERYGCEPDMRCGPCEDCGRHAVYGAEELLLHCVA
jgi:hypothetical protein